LELLIRNKWPRLGRAAQISWHLKTKTSEARALKRAEQLRTREIKNTKLIGASDGFVR